MTEKQILDEIAWLERSTTRGVKRIPGYTTGTTRRVKEEDEEKDIHDRAQAMIQAYWKQETKKARMAKAAATGEPESSSSDSDMPSLASDLAQGQACD